MPGMQQRGGASTPGAPMQRPGAHPGFEIDRKRSMFSTDSEIRMHDGKPMCSQSVYFHWFFNRKWSGEVLNR